MAESAQPPAVRRLTDAELEMFTKFIERSRASAEAAVFDKYETLKCLERTLSMPNTTNVVDCKTLDDCLRHFSDLQHYEKWALGPDQRFARLAGLCLILEYAAKHPCTFAALTEPVREALKLHLPQGESKDAFEEWIRENPDPNQRDFAGLGLDLYEFAWPQQASPPLA